MTYKISSADVSEADPLLAPARLWSAPALCADWSCAPAAAGVYAVWLDVALSDASPARQSGWRPAYVGVAGGRGRGTLRRRLRQHLAGPCAQSTLRRTLAALLLDALEMQPALSASRKIRLAAGGEAKLSRWLALHARLCWIEHPEPRRLERALLSNHAPPLNIDGAPDSATRMVKEARLRLREIARRAG